MYTEKIIQWKLHSKTKYYRMQGMLTIPAAFDERPPLVNHAFLCPYLGFILVISNSYKFILQT